MNQQDVFIKMALDSWNIHIKRFDNILDKLTDEQLMQEISPSKNRGIYLLGHLAGIHDMMLPLLRFSDSLYPELSFIFVDQPDKAVTDLPSASQLRNQWKKVNEKLVQHFSSLAPDEWFTRHASISEEDFMKEPHRNRLNVVLNRTAHLSYHLGQMALLVKKS